jgi:hypothetical protein
MLNAKKELSHHLEIAMYRFVVSLLLARDLLIKLEKSLLSSVFILPT